MTLHYLITKDDYETTLKTIQLDHSYSNVKLNNRCKHFPTVYLFKQTSNSLSIERSTEASLQFLEDNAVLNHKISDKYFDIASSMEKITFLEQWAYVAKLCNKDYEGLVLNKKHYKSHIKGLLKIVKSLTMKLKTRPVSQTGIEHVAYRMSCVEEAYHHFISNIAHLPLPKIHEALVRRLDGDDLASYISLLQTFFHHCPSSCSHLMKDLKKKMPEETHELLRMLLTTPCHLVHKPLQTMPQQLKFLVAPDYMMTLTKDPLKDVCKMLRGLGKVKKIKRPPFVDGFQRRMKEVGEGGVVDGEGGREEMIMTYMRYVVSAVEANVKEMKEDKMPIVLICQNNTSLFSSLMNLADVTAVICLGFPLSEEHQGNINMKAPTLFIVGEHHLPIKQLESLTRSANHSTGLVMVEGADGHLNMREEFKGHYFLSQHIADVLIANLTRDFIAHILELNS